jgi:hypothetical protein
VEKQEIEKEVEEVCDFEALTALLSRLNLENWLRQ